ncbi:NACHT, LRR and PYD domains-containing protein 3-like [Megalops cyprinoides]|uniref:NACHT, LRR and PYD domains-containing protein 3-like n=1 Tax=Megalops cyprinoides TaxID=118141 RepID=UPI001864C8E3|nr:NACHT, LRR and PYD domains-containing protein 3-like [Megalops cyprinoides]
MGQLAFQHLEDGDRVYREEDLRKCGICDSEIAEYSWLCKETFKRDSEKPKLYRFTFSFLKDYFAALYVFFNFKNNNKNLLDEAGKHVSKWSKLLKRLQQPDLLKRAVDSALASENGHLDLFLRFLLGISQRSNQSLLRGLLTQGDCGSQGLEETLKHIKGKIKKNPSPERTIDLLHCLSELDDGFLVEEVQRFQAAGCVEGEELSPAQCSALAYVLLTSEEAPDEFNLKKFVRSDEGLLRLLPVVRRSRRALLDNSNITMRGCETLATSISSGLIELDLSHNDLQDSGVKLLSGGLRNPHCRLEILRLANCKLTMRCCGVLAAALCSERPPLKELILSHNDLQDSGVKLLSDGLWSPHCCLETLSLDWCNLTEKCCEALGSALCSNPSHLRELHLNDNDLLDSGVKLLSDGLGNPHCKLETLGLSGCRVTEAGCASLASALRSNPSHLRELDLSYNHPGDSGVRALSAELKDPSSKLEKLK